LHSWSGECIKLLFAQLVMGIYKVFALRIVAQLVHCLIYFFFYLMSSYLC